METFIDDKLKPCILHELSHQIGGKDHYHEKIPNYPFCANYEICSRCSELNEDAFTIRSEECIMFNSERSLNSDQMYCYECSSEIHEFLDEGGY